MSVSNEELVRLYQSTEDKKNKEILYKKLYKKNYGLIYTICGSFLERNKNKNIEILDMYQEVSYILLEAIKTFNFNKNAKFSSYFSNIAYKHISKFIRDKYIKLDREQLVGSLDNPMWSYAHNLVFRDEFEVIDNSSFNDNIRICIKQIKFRDERSRFIFECRHGLNQFNRCMTCNEIANIVHLTQQRIDVICKNYESKLKKIILNEIDSGRFSIEDFGLDARVL